MTRIGKIARLPKDIRDVVNKRLLDGHPAPDIISWLNEQPAVKTVLEKDFEGEAISQNNVSTWKKGGYHDWKEEIEALSARSGAVYWKCMENGGLNPSVVRSTICTGVAGPPIPCGNSRQLPACFEVSSPGLNCSTE